MIHEEVNRMLPCKCVLALAFDTHSADCPAYYRPAVAAALAASDAELKAIKLTLNRDAGYHVERCACVFDEDDTPITECNYHRDLKAERDAAFVRGQTEILKAVGRAISLHACDVNGICMCMVHILKDVDAIAAEIEKAGK